MAKALNILILEDVWLVAEHFAQMLRQVGHKVVGPCATSNAALDAINHHKVDVAFLDVELHQGKSFLVADRMVQLCIPFTFLSGYGKSDVPTRLQGQPLINKPVVEHILVDAIDRMRKLL